MTDLPVRMPPFAVCYEASCGDGRLYEMLKGLAARIAVAHPGLLRLIDRSNQKHDRLDAEKPARLRGLELSQSLHAVKRDQLVEEIESGTQVASRGPTWRTATPAE